MSLLNASGLNIATKLFLKWDPKSSSSTLIPAMVTAVKMGTDLSPFRVFVEVTRLERVLNEENVVLLLLQQNENTTAPTLSFAKSGDTVTWTLPSQGPTQQQARPQLGSLTKRAPAGEVDDGDLLASYSRPIRVLSYKVQNALDRFPPVSARATEVNANMISRDIRVQHTPRMGVTRLARHENHEYLYRAHTRVQGPRCAQI